MKNLSSVSLTNRVYQALIIVLVFLTSLLFSLHTQAQSSGDYRSKASGNWGSASTWQSFNGSSWVNASSTPTYSNGSITIQGTDSVWINDDVSVDQLTINNGAKLMIKNGKTMTVKNGTGTDLTINGKLYNVGTLTTEVAAVTMVSSGTIYNMNGGTFKNTATFTTNAGSIFNNQNGATFNHENATSTSIGGTFNNNAGASFSNMTGGTFSLSGTFNHNGNTLTSLSTILSISSTGIFNMNASLLMSGSSFTNAGAFFIASGTVLFSFSPFTNSGNLKIGGSFYQQNGNSFANSGTVRLTLTGYLQMAGAMTNSGTAKIIDSSAAANPSAALSGSGSYIFNNSSTYTRAINGGTIPTSSWNNTSTCIITGMTTTAPAGLGQSFMNFTWNSASQSANALFAGALTTVNGEFNLLSSGTGYIKIGNTSGNSGTLSIGGSLNISGGTFYLSSEINWTLSITGNYNQSGGTFGFFSATNSATNPMMNLTGNFNISGGNYIMTNYTGATANAGNGTLNLYGNFSFSGGTITESGTTTANSGIGYFNFKNNVLQSVSGTGSITNSICFTVYTNAIVDLGSSQLTGTGFFTVQSNSTLRMGHTQGISAASASGNVLCTGTRTFSTTASYVYNGTSAQISGNGLPTTVTNLTVSNASGLTLTNGVTVTGTLTFTAGTISTGAAELQVSNNSAYAINGYGSGKFVIGNLRRTVAGTGTYIWPLGASANYEPLTVTLSGITGMSTLLGVFSATNPLAHASIPSTTQVNGTPITGTLDYGYWTLTPDANPSAGTYNISVTLSGASNTGAQASQYSVLKNNTGNGTWISEGTHNNNTQLVNGTAVTAVRTALSTFGSFAIGIGGSPLPVQMTGFAVRLDNNAAVLEWETAAELNNHYFSVEKSLDGNHYTAIAKVDGAGTSTLAHQYSFTDENPGSGTIYYRIAQTDFDGTSTYSATRFVALADAPIQLQVYPNPALSGGAIHLEGNIPAGSTLRLSDLQGRLLTQLVLTDNISSITLDQLYPNTLPAGTYLLQAIQGNNMLSQKLIVE